MASTEILIVGGGIAGLTLALSLHQAGIAVRVYEAVPDLRPLGVGINLQPTAVRELSELGLGEELARSGIATRELRFATSSASSSGGSSEGSRRATGGRNTRSTAVGCRRCCCARCASASGSRISAAVGASSRPPMRRARARALHSTRRRERDDRRGRCPGRSGRHSFGGSPPPPSRRERAAFRAANSLARRRRCAGVPRWPHHGHRRTLRSTDRRLSDRARRGGGTTPHQLDLPGDGAGRDPAARGMEPTRQR